MSTIPPSNPAASQSSQRKRIYLACVNCRHRKVRCITTGDSPDTPCQRCVKHGLICDYVPVSLEREKSLFDTPPGEGSNLTHSPTMPPSWSQAPPHNGTYGRSNYAPPSAPHFNPSYGQPGAPSQFNSVPGYLPGRSHPAPPPAVPFPNPATPHFLSPPTNPYTRGTNPFPQSTQLGHYPMAQPSHPHPFPTPTFQLDSSYSNFGAAPPTYPAQYSRCVCPPTGPCHCGLRSH